MKSKIAVLWLAVLAVAALPVLAQQEDPGEVLEEGAYVETVEVNLVNVDVYVTDKKGNPITGLTLDNFELLEDGDPVAITNFTAFEMGSPVGESLEVQPAEIPKSEALLLPDRTIEVEVPAEQRLYLVIYVDNFNIRPFNRNRVFRRLREFLNDNVTKQDRVMLVSYDRSLHIRHHFTSDPQLISAALFDLEDVTGHAVHLDADRRDLLREIDEAEEVREVEWRVRQFAENQYNDLSFSIDAMEEIVQSLSGLPGRKAVLYVSDGLPMVPAEDLYYAMSQKFSTSSVILQSRQFDASRKFLELSSRASTGRIAIYSIDAAGLRVAMDSSAEVRGSSTTGIPGMVDSVYTANIQSPLMMMAEQTGGLAIYNTNDVGPSLAKVAADLKSYYSLGYTPAHNGTGRLYKIKVRVKGRKGLVVRHRSSYRDHTLHVRMTDMAKSTLAYGVTVNPLQLEMRLGQAVPHDKDLYDMAVEVRIPLDNIVTLPLSEVHEARLKLYFGAMDEEGDMSEVSEVDLPIRIPNEQFEETAGMSYSFQTRLRMRTGGHRVAVGVWDELGAVSSFITKSVNIGSG